jgi:mannosylglycerate hydrolase
MSTGFLKTGKQFMMDTIVFLDLCAFPCQSCRYRARVEEVRMAGATTVHIVSHTHWDREWFLSSTLTSEWLPALFDSLFAMLEKQPEYRFILDGQTLMLEDWLDALRRQGEDPSGYRQRLASYARQRRVMLGPYYVQPDWQLVSAESLVRNLLVGGKMAGQFGPCMKVGWLLDNFGQISQAVQIHRGFGLEGVFVWRGVQMEPESLRMELLWESPDGSVLTAIYLLDSYRNAMRLAAYPQALESRILSEVEKLQPFAATGHILLMNGYDQETEPDNILPYLKSVRRDGLILVQSRPEELIAAVEKQRRRLPRVKGLQYSGRYVSVFPGTLSSRMYLKTLNHECQRLLERQAEPLGALRWLLDGKHDPENLLALWKLLLQNHAHDSICGVCIDDVHADMERRLEKIIGLAGDTCEETLASLARLIDTSQVEDGAEPYLIFNPSLGDANGIVTIHPRTEAWVVMDASGAVLPTQRTVEGCLHVHVRDTPALGYQAIQVLPRGGKTESCPCTADAIDPVRVDERERTVENRYLRARLNDDGSLDVFDKISECDYRGLAVFEDRADAGDSYDFSPPPGDMPIYSRSRAAEIRVLERGPLRGLVELTIRLDLPEELCQDRRTRCSERRAVPIVCWVSLEAASPLLRFRTRVKNTVKDHRLRVLFPTGLATEVSCADTQFDVVQHEITAPSQRVEPLPPNLERILLGARESQPTAVFPQCRFVDLSDGGKGMAVLNRGLPAYEILSGSNTVALTLFRSVGWLARSDLSTRTGDAGPRIRTPEAQCLREMEFNYALYFHQGDWRGGKVHRQAEHFNSALPLVKTDRHPGVLSCKDGFLRLCSPGDVLQVTALKRSEDGVGLVVRCYNPGHRTVKGTLISKVAIAGAHYTDLPESAVRRIAVADGNRLTFTAKPKRIITLKLVVGADRPPIDGSARIFSQVLRPDEFERQADLSAYPSMPVVATEDIEKEERRVEAIGGELAGRQKEAEKIEQRLQEAPAEQSAGMNTELQVATAAVATCERMLLEAQLSLTLLKKKHSELEAESGVSYEEDFEAKCREIGFKLNQARIRKRTYDYLLSQGLPARDSAPPAPG